MTTRLVVMDIVKDRLQADGYCGLVNYPGECACKTDDLAPCGEIDGDCEAGYSEPCTDACDHESGFSSDPDWHIKRGKRP